MREPSTVIWMIGGPFVVLFLFGVGSIMATPPPKTIVVTQGQQEQTSFQISPQELSGYLDVTEVTDDLSRAMAQLQARRVSLVLILPDRPLETVQNGQRSIIKVFVNEINPVRLAFIRIDITAQITRVNNAAQRSAIDLGKENLRRAEEQLSQVERILEIAGISPQDITSALDIIRTVERIPTDVLVAPFEADTENITSQEPTVVNYFTPAAIALVIQHLAVTLAALSMVRARLLGTFHLWQTTPVRLGEIVAGHYFSYGVLAIAVSAILISALTWALGVVVLGSIPFFWISVLLLVLASLGIGFVISLLATNEQTAAQMAMIILLASIFLGGLVVPLEQITFPVLAVSYLLPATYGIEILHSVMNRGEPGNVVLYIALGLIALVGLIMTVRLFQRQLRPT